LIVASDRNSSKAEVWCRTRGRWLKGALGDALHTISCAAGYNLRWLLRAIARLGIGPAFLCLLQWLASPALAIHAWPAGHNRVQSIG